MKYYSTPQSYFSTVDNVQQSLALVEVLLFYYCCSIHGAGSSCWRMLCVQPLIQHTRLIASTYIGTESKRRVQTQNDNLTKSSPNSNPSQPKCGIQPRLPTCYKWQKNSFRTVLVKMAIKMIQAVILLLLLSSFLCFTVIRQFLVLMEPLT